MDADTTQQDAPPDRNSPGRRWRGSAALVYVWILLPVMLTFVLRGVDEHALLAIVAASAITLLLTSYQRGVAEAHRASTGITQDEMRAQWATSNERSDRLAEQVERLADELARRPRD